MSKPNDDDAAPLQGIVMRLVVDLSVDEAFAICKNSDDKSERDWFHEDLLGDPELFLHSNLVGETIGTVKVVSVETA
jgi:hypothetical protein